mmetsp:Transcript_67788/g.174714  ORF Transcript_67788/g.174714 Transcript_67788/m.174714 type:complete len:269 (+) Transcript_67788:205-1011(+)
MLAHRPPPLQRHPDQGDGNSEPNEAHEGRRPGAPPDHAERTAALTLRAHVPLLEEDRGRLRRYPGGQRRQHAADALAGLGLVAPPPVAIDADEEIELPWLANDDHRHQVLDVGGLGQFERGLHLLIARDDVDACALGQVRCDVRRHRVGHGAPGHLVVVVGQLALVEVHLAALPVPADMVAPDDVLHRRAVGGDPVAIDHEAVLGEAVIGLADHGKSPVWVGAAVVVVGVPEPHVVQHHIIAVDLHHRVRANDGAALVLEGANADEDV